MKLYPKATQSRLTWSELWHKGGKNLLYTAVKNFILLQILFLALFAYIFGSLFQQTTHIHNITIAFVDYDGGAIGAAVRVAYASLQTASFPTLVEKSPSDYLTPADLEPAVCRTDYWAALYVSQGASGRLQAALGGGQPALTYDPSNVLTFVWDEARYSVTADPLIAINLQTLSNAARVAYSKGNGTGQVQNVTSAEALTVLANPWVLSQEDIQPTTQGSRAIYNTLVIVLILIQEFFYLGTLNGIYIPKMYTKLHPTRIIFARYIHSLAYTFVGSLCITGAIWAFRSGWNVNANQFVLSWMVLWLFAHLNFFTLDVFTIWLPPPYVPMALITWVVLNVTSILLPFELSPGFYKIGYIFPAHEVYQVLVDIWSFGCNPQLSYALPIMFAWEIACGFLSAIGVYRRSHYASLAEEEREREFAGRLEAAMAFDRKREAEVRKADAEAAAKAAEPTPADSEGIRTPTATTAAERTDSIVRQELTEAIETEDRMIQRQKSKASKACNFGPSFDLPFQDSDTTL